MKIQSDYRNRVINFFNVSDGEFQELKQCGYIHPDFKRPNNGRFYISVDWGRNFWDIVEDLLNITKNS